ncbi:conjugative transposon protein TraM [Pedobacter glucosidilyticus]|uniref:conjugative transposon protein TraM n=1 Tax=Pedobacter glucosidilyticus TaxID=1122941 RepID=UPI0026ED4834|nr:conjugative transposon protein TraM [Pedobacter glucosidilyticus]
METNEKNKRKLLWVLPLLILPFMALAFYALGGGKGDVSAQELNANRGINTSLPDAQFKKEEPQDKWSIYEQAKSESAGEPDSLSLSVAGQSFAATTSIPDPNEQRIHEKLAQINQEINRPAQPKIYSAPSTGSTAAMSKDVDRLEKLMRSMQEDKTEDPEMQQLSGMLDKILAIQNPDLITRHPGKANTVKPDSKFRAIPAVIADAQKAVQGAAIRLCLQDTITINGQLIPKGHSIFGTCRITNQRLLLDIQNIRLGNSIIPVDLTVYSLDGMVGIDAPEAMLADAAGNGAVDAVRSIGMYGIDQSIAAQVAGAGIDAAKDLFDKKVRRIKVKLKAGQSVLLCNNQLRN